MGLNSKERMERGTIPPLHPSPLPIPVPFRSTVVNISNRYPSDYPTYLVNCSTPTVLVSASVLYIRERLKRSRSGSRLCPCLRRKISKCYDYKCGVLGRVGR